MINSLQQTDPSASRKQELLTLLLKRKGIDSPKVDTIERGDASLPAPLSFAQQRLWFLDQLEPGSAVYSIPTVVRIEGKLSVILLERCLDEIIKRHHSLRTIFESKEGQPHQIVIPPSPFSLRVIELGGMEPAARLPEAARLATTESRHPFDLARGPLFRALLLRLSDDDHVLVICMHHIISDGWSKNILLQEVAALYDAYATDKQPYLAELPIQYADFARWQVRRLQGEALDKQLAYWKERLGGSLPVLELPTDYPRPATRSYSGARQSFAIPSTTATALKALARKHEASLFMTLLAAFQTLLWRYTGQPDIVVGTPINNRNRVELEGMIGLFLNTLALRTDLSGNPTFADLLQRVREVALGAYANQDLPFEKIVEELHPERSLNHTPLFQVMLVLQDGGAAQASFGGLNLAPLKADSGTAKFDLILDLVDTGRELLGVCEYSTELFESASIRRLLEHLSNLLQAAAADANCKISELGMMSEAERQQILIDWNQTATEYGQAGFVHQLIAQQAARTPAAVAVRFQHHTLTYAQLDARANQLAHFLQARGVGPDRLVGICLPRSLDLIVALVATLKAGAAFVPIDPTYPAQRIAYMLEDAGTDWLLSQPEVAAGLPPQAGRLICLERDRAAIAACPPTAPTVELSGDHLAYVLYTSGSTGRPKGAMNTQAGLRNRLLWMQEVYQLSSADRVLQKTPMSFDVSVWEYFWPLMTGACLVVAAPEGHKDSRYLVEVMKREAVSVAHFVPAMLQVFLSEEGVEELTELRQVICSGEALGRELARRAGERLAGEVDNLYGPTEAAIDVTRWRCERGSERREVPIGRAIANTQMYVLDEELKVVPVGVRGELYIGGVQVGRGYWKRAEQTAERYVPNPYGEAGSRMYRTGDEGRYGEDGEIEYMGRGDEQVKIRGMRIEVGEVEAVLAEVSGEEAAVVVKGEGSGKRLVGYVVGEGEGEELKRRLRERLPEWMVPGVIEYVEELPKQPNGKVDRGELRKREEKGEEAGVEVEWAKGEEEERVERIWVEVLGRERIGRRENFFEIGGHSLVATQVMSRVRRELEVEVELRSLFEAPTIAGLAEIIRQARLTAQQIELPPIEPMPTGLEPPLSFSQRRMWFLNRLNPGDAAYNMPVLFRLNGPLDPEVLARSFNQVIARHEILRTTFPAVGNLAIQRVSPSLSFTLPMADLTHLREDEREAAGIEKATELAAAPFDLEIGPLLRAQLYKLSEQQHMVAVVMHHIICDGWSVGLLLQELAATYEALYADEPSPLPGLPVQYKDFAYWQRQWLRGERLASQLAYWQQQLGGRLPTLDLPTDRPRTATAGSRGARYSWTLPPSLTEPIKRLGRQHGATLYMTLLAAFKTLLHQYTGQVDILVGSPMADRPRVEAEQLIGCFLNTLVLRTDMSGNPAFTELLQRVREVTLGAFANKDIPYEEIVEGLRMDRNRASASLFQVTFALHNNPRVEMSGKSGLKLEPIETDNGTAQFDLLLLMHESGQAFNATFMYNTDLFDRATIARLGSHFESLLETIVARPDSRLSALKIYREEKPQVMENRTSLDAGRGRFPSVKPKAIKLSSRELVKRSDLLAGEPLPLVVQPEIKDLDLAEWAASHMDLIGAELLARGGILFRDFNLVTADDFQRFVNAVIAQTMPYQERSTPRTEVSKNVFTSTEYPPEQHIAMHNEFSYARTWPMKITFFCERAPAQGGETPIADCRKVYRRIPSEIRERFINKQIMYVRNYGSAIDLPWQTVFQTNDPRQVEAYCRKAPIDFEWVSASHLRTRQVRQAAATHPVTGETVWFNQAHLFHLSNLESDVRQSLLATFADADLPRNAYFGDGSAIAEADLDCIREAFREATVMFAWQPGDVLLLDNMLIAHGRSPFAGSRRILAAMGDASRID